MVFSENSKISELLENEDAKVVLEKHFPGFTTNPQLGMATGLKLKVLAGFPQANIKPEQLQACVKDLAKIEA